MESRQELIIDKCLLRPNFLCYLQLRESIMFTISDCTVAKSAMLDQCIQYFCSYETHLTSINKFAKKYQSHQASHWYTKDSFIHRIVNKVLRTGNIECCYLLRFYITDLSEQLYQLKRQQQKNVTKTGKSTILYRGLRQSEAHLKTLQNLVGQIILTKGFMSTSRDKRIALWYAGASDSQSPQSQPLLIEINVDMTAPDIIAADIAHLSNFPTEQEVLFDIGAQFRVESLEYNSLNGIWHCRLVAMSNEPQALQFFQQFPNDEICVDLSTYSEEEAKLERVMRRERQQKFTSTNNNQESGSLRCNLPSVSWIAISSSDRARIFQQKALIHWHRNADIHQFHAECIYAWELLNQGNDGTIIEDNDTACFLNNCGLTCQRLGYTDQAIHLLKRALEIRNRLGASDLFLAQTLRNLALAYTDKGDYENALVLLNQALIIGQQALSTAQWSTSLTLRNICYFYHAQGDYAQAAEYLSKALETFRQCVNLWIEDHEM